MNEFVSAEIGWHNLDMTEKTLAEKYPYVSYWIQDGQIEIGPNYYLGKGICAVANDEGGTICQKCGFDGLEDALEFLETGGTAVR